MKAILILSSLSVFLFSTLTFAGATYSDGGPYTESTVTVTATAQKVINSASSRLYLLIINKGSDSVFLKAGAAPASGEGIPIPPGGNYEPKFPSTDDIYLKAASGIQTMELIFN